MNYETESTDIKKENHDSMIMLNINLANIHLFMHKNCNVGLTVFS